MGDGSAVMSSSANKVRYNDGKWHVVEAARDRLVGLLKIDGEEVAKVYLCFAKMLFKVFRKYCSKSMDSYIVCYFSDSGKRS